MTHQRTTRQETMLAVIQTRKGVEKHIDRHIGEQQRNRGQDPLSLPIRWNKGHLTKWRPLFPRFGLRRGGLLPTEPAAFQHAHWPWPHSGWNGQSVPS